ncbi:hypothetical protein ACFL2V_04100 [Pseudomonadota bacterium]
MRLKSPNYKIFSAIFLCGFCHTSFSNIAIKDEERNDNFKAYLEFSAGYNNNPLQAGIDGDPILVEREAVTNSDDQKTVAMGIEYKFIDKYSYDAKLLFDHFNETFYLLKEASWRTSTISLPISIYADKTRFRIKGVYASDESNNVAVVKRYEREFEISRKTDLARASISYSLTDLEPPSETYQYLTGTSREFGLNLTFPKSNSNFSVGASKIQDRHNDTDENIVSQSGYRARFIYTSIHDGLRWHYLLDYRRKNYVEEPATGFIRRDNTIVASIEPSIIVSENVRLFWKNKLVRNDSNKSQSDDDKSYFQFSSLIGMSLDL